MRGGTNFPNFAPKMLFLRGFGKIFEGLLNMVVKNAGVSQAKNFKGLKITQSPMKKALDLGKIAKFRGGVTFSN